MMNLQHGIEFKLISFKSKFRFGDPEENNRKTSIATNLGEIETQFFL
jgi:hypothetical protein